MSHRIAFPFLFALFVMMALNPGQVFAQRPCEALASLTVANATITSATSIEAGAYKPPNAPNQAPPRADMPAFCRVAGIASRPAIPRLNSRCGCRFPPGTASMSRLATVGSRGPFLWRE